ncbi:unnamed protein product [Nesidiocoris tenuis]|uniref:Protein kinase domain-containing protein n=1 Tax=Nesidiocoris tenuis TaxID=355587 RepID=A0A6H5HJB1_9HEMI|nr:unnamed protein product [Nesidiocoris tenuis]
MFVELHRIQRFGKKTSNVIQAIDRVKALERNISNSQEQTELHMFRELDPSEIEVLLVYPNNDVLLMQTMKALRKLLRNYVKKFKTNFSVHSFIRASIAVRAGGRLPKIDESDWSINPRKIHVLPFTVKTKLFTAKFAPLDFCSSVVMNDHHKCDKCRKAITAFILSASQGLVQMGHSRGPRAGTLNEVGHHHTHKVDFVVEQVVCDSQGIAVTITFAEPFDGVIYSKGHFHKQSCRGNIPVFQLCEGACELGGCGAESQPPSTTVRPQCYPGTSDPRCPTQPTSPPATQPPQCYPGSNDPRCPRPPPITQSPPKCYPGSRDPRCPSPPTSPPATQPPQCYPGSTDPRCPRPPPTTQSPPNCYPGSRDPRCPSQPTSLPATQPPQCYTGSNDPRCPRPPSTTARPLNCYPGSTDSRCPTYLVFQYKLGVLVSEGHENRTPRSSRFLERSIGPDEYILSKFVRDYSTSETLSFYESMMSRNRDLANLRAKELQKIQEDEKRKSLYTPWKLLKEKEKDGSSRLKTDFEIIEKLGSGAFGQVFKVMNKLDGCYYAIKKIILNCSNKRAHREITREIKLLSRLNHENVVRYYNSWVEFDEGQEEGRSRRRTWRTRLKRSWPRGDTFFPTPHPTSTYSRRIDRPTITIRTFSKILLHVNAIDEDHLYKDRERAWRLFREIVEGLCHIHDQKIMHRDLKPPNIFLDRNDQVKIGDFGLAKASRSHKRYGAVSFAPPLLTPGPAPSNGVTVMTSVGGIVHATPDLQAPFARDCSALTWISPHIHSLNMLKQQLVKFPVGIAHFYETRGLRQVMNTRFQLSPHQIHSCLDFSPIIKNLLYSFNC